MLKPSLFISGILVFCLAGCAAQEKGPAQAESPEPPAAALHETPYTTVQSIHVGEQLKGYLLSYESIPSHASMNRTIPAGTVFIKDLDFNNLGFITPKGELWRYGEGNIPERIHQSHLNDNLAVFFEVPEKEITLKDI
jgi:hypothetical protein